MDKQIKLSLGCGSVVHPGYIHIDALKYSHIKYHDVTKLPFSACSVDSILASHLIAYFDRQEIKLIIQHWYNVLKFGGSIRIATPDLEVLCEIISKYGGKDQDILGPLFGRIEGFGGQNIYHKTVYTFESLKILLKSVGFKNIKRYNWWEYEKDYINDQQKCYWPKNVDNEKSGIFSDDQIFIGLNVIAIK